MKLLCVLCLVLAGCGWLPDLPDSIRYDMVYEITSEGCRVDTVRASWVDLSGPLVGGQTSVEFHQERGPMVYVATKPITYRIIDSVRAL